MRNWHWADRLNNLNYIKMYIYATQNLHKPEGDEILRICLTLCDRGLALALSLSQVTFVRDVIMIYPRREYKY